MLFDDWNVRAYSCLYFNLNYQKTFLYEDFQSFFPLNPNIQLTSLQKKKITQKLISHNIIPFPTNFNGSGACVNCRWGGRNLSWCFSYCKQLKTYGSLLPPLVAQASSYSWMIFRIFIIGTFKDGFDAGKVRLSESMSRVLGFPYWPRWITMDIDHSR